MIRALLNGQKKISPSQKYSVGMILCRMLSWMDSSCTIVIAIARSYSLVAFIEI